MDDVYEANWRRGLDWAFLLEAATPIAYVCAYQFDLGRLEHVGLPNTLSDAAVKDILHTAAAMLTVGWFVYTFLDMLSKSEKIY